MCPQHVTVSDAYRFAGERMCYNQQVRTDLLDQSVWQEVCGLLEDPQRVAREYVRRLQPPEGDELGSLQAQTSKLQQGVVRLIDSYAEGVIEKGEFEPRVARLRQRIATLEAQAQQIADSAQLQADLRLVIGRLDDFAAKVQDGLGEADWLTRRDIIRALVKRVEVSQDQVTVVFRVAPDPFVPSPEKGVLLHCSRRDVTRTGEHHATDETHPAWQAGTSDPGSQSVYDGLDWLLPPVRRQECVRVFMDIHPAPQLRSPYLLA